MNSKNIKKALVIKALNKGFEDVKSVRKNEFLGSIRIPKISAREFLVHQICFMSKITWFFTLALTLGSIVIIAVFGNDKGNALWNIGAISPFLAMTSLMELTKSGSYKMAEIEESCLYNRHQLILSRLIILGCANIVGILLIAFTAKLSMGENMLHTLLYLMMPYMLACIMSLNILKKSRKNDANMLCAMVSGSVMIMYVVVGNLYKVMFETKHIGIVGLITVILGIWTINVIKGYIYPTEGNYDTYYR